ncbi:MAG: hypothetical protein JNL32_12115 [Candidatus Kapabacteria bacterium]|nr:hypothetical protein [Candidatus Kapabacteria bacterium]
MAEDVTVEKKEKKRTRKAKYIVLYSPFLMRETKHELIGEPMETENGKQQWARCTVSHHSQLINLDALQAQQERISTAAIRISREDSKQYSPKSEYQIGDVIYHKVWDDVGIVRSKEVMTNGGNAIVVLFEKSKEKRLIEKL